jgi:hypothetical protein
MEFVNLQLTETTLGASATTRPQQLRHFFKLDFVWEDCGGSRTCRIVSSQSAVTNRTENDMMAKIEQTGMDKYQQFTLMRYFIER